MKYRYWYVPWPTANIQFQKNMNLKVGPLGTKQLSITLLERFYLVLKSKQAIAILGFHQETWW